MRTRKVLFGVLCAAALQACAAGPPRLAPLPARVESFDGYGSISIRGGAVTAKSRFAFSFRRPDGARIEALDMFGRTLAVLHFGGGAAHLVLPSRKIYWKGPEEEIMDKFIGFGLRASELASLVGGLWDNPPGGAAWSIERDDRGRPWKGTRDGFRFETLEFFRGAPVPRTISFAGPTSSGRVRVLKIRFNGLRSGGRADAPALAGLRETDWAEIEAVLRNED